MSIVPALISAGSGLLSSVGTAIQGHRNRKFAREMLQRQMDYQDKVNQQQMDFTREINEYNSPANQRKRLEAAGYNPFLNEINSGNGTATSLGASVAPLSAEEGNVLQGVAHAASNFSSVYNAMESAKGVALENDRKSYELKKQKDNDNAVDKDGHSAYNADGRKKLAEVSEAESRANISATEAFISNLSKIWQTSDATDANGNPLTDADGNPISNYSAGEDAKLKQSQKSVEKLANDIAKGQVDIDNASIDNLIKRYNLQYLLPAQLTNLREQFMVYKSQISLNNASAKSALSSAALADENAATTRGLRPWQISNEKNSAAESYYGARLKGVALDEQRALLPLTKQVSKNQLEAAESWLSGTAPAYVAPWSGVIGSALGGAVGYGVGYSTSRLREKSDDRHNASVFRKIVKRK